MFSMFQYKRSRDGDDFDDGCEIRGTRRTITSDDESGSYFADPDIDSRASDYIANFHRSRIMNSESQTYAY